MTATATRPVALAAGRRRGDFLNVVRAELSKLCTVRSTYMALLAAAASNIGFAVLAAAVIAPRLNAHDRRRADVVQLALAGVHLSQIAFGVLGALIITSEYSTGMIRTTLAATPRRRTLLAGRCCVVPCLRVPEHVRDAALVQMVITRSSKAARSWYRPGVSVVMS